jgi:2-dehydropantoate 2-reductase
MTRAAHLLAAMTGAHINAELSEDIRLDLWKKFIFISSVGGLTALTQLSLDEILSVAETRSLLVRAMQECESIALAQGIRIEPEFINATLEVLRGFNPDTRSSLYYDLVHGKPMEVEALPGTVVRLGRRLGIATPVHETIFASLLPYHLKHGGTTSHKP